MPPSWEINFSDADDDAAGKNIFLYLLFIGCCLALLLNATSIESTRGCYAVVRTEMNNKENGRELR